MQRRQTEKCTVKAHTQTHLFVCIKVQICILLLTFQQLQQQRVKSQTNSTAMETSTILLCFSKEFIYQDIWRRVSRGPAPQFESTGFSLKHFVRDQVTLVHRSRSGSQPQQKYCSTKKNFLLFIYVLYLCKTAIRNIVICLLKLLIYTLICSPNE